MNTHTYTIETDIYVETWLRFFFTYLYHNLRMNKRTTLWQKCHFVHLNWLNSTRWLALSMLLTVCQNPWRNERLLPLSKTHSSQLYGRLNVSEWASELERKKEREILQTKRPHATFSLYTVQCTQHGVGAERMKIKEMHCN